MVRVRAICITVPIVLIAAATSGCSLVLDFSDNAVPKDAAIDAPDAVYTTAECMYREPNDTLATAAVVTIADTGPAAICDATGGVEDHDFYKLTVPTGTTKVSVSINFVERSTGDLDLRLYDSTGNIVAQSRGFTDTELIVCPGTSPPCSTLAAGDYTFEVFPAVAGSVNVYTMALALTPPPP